MQFSYQLKVWLWIGVIMVFIQILLGGITRLTGSGLSITEWEIVVGTFPPLSEEAWQEEFYKYQQTPQFRKINNWMELKDFKEIYWWEYFHRLWGRIMGLVFLIPFVYFLAKGKINKWLFKRLIVVILLAALAASFGWIMVASGLVERPWVNAYKLMFHLILAALTFGYLLWLSLQVYTDQIHAQDGRGEREIIFFVLTILVYIQVALGGLMSGIKACIYYPTWPDMKGHIIPPEILERDNWVGEAFLSYENYWLLPALVQSLHRYWGYLIFFICTYLFITYILKSSRYYIFRGGIIWFSLLVIQIILGILTLINCGGYIPFFLGISHQAFGFLFLGATLAIYFLERNFRYSEKHK